MTRRFNVTNQNFNPSSDADVDKIKSGFDALQDVIEKHVPDSARKTIALRNMEVACMYAVRAVFDGDE